MCSFDDDHLQKVLQCVNEVLSLCSVLGLDFGQTVGDVHPSLHGTQVEQSTNISNSTLEGLEQAILKLKIERKTRISEGDFSAAYLIAFRLIGFVMKSIGFCYLPHYLSIR